MKNFQICPFRIFTLYERNSIDLKLYLPLLHLSRLDGIICQDMTHILLHLSLVSYYNFFNKKNILQFF